MPKRVSGLDVSPHSTSAQVPQFNSLQFMSRYSKSDGQRARCRPAALPLLNKHRQCCIATQFPAQAAAGQRQRSGETGDMRQHQPGYCPLAFSWHEGRQHYLYTRCTVRSMARPRHPIDQHRDYITHLYLNGVSRSRITYKLRKHHHVAVNCRTLSRRIANRGLPRQQARTKESPELIDTTHDLIFRIGLTEKQTLSVLQRQGWPITKRGLKRIRLHPDRRWLRRLNTEEERLALLERTEQAIIEITQRSNAIAGYGKSLLQPYLRQQKQL
ncbi:hypothetical protein MAN_10023, partial [Metarhizium hybridum]